MDTPQSSSPINEFWAGVRGALATIFVVKFILFCILLLQGMGFYLLERLGYQGDLLYYLPILVSSLLLLGGWSQLLYLVPLYFIRRKSVPRYALGILAVSMILLLLTSWCNAALISGPW